jgi:quercetin dioxygenase-like cupin family protein
MLTVLTAADLIAPGHRTMKFEGAPYDADVSFFVVDLDEGQGPELHTHPYAEVFIPIQGSALFSVDDAQREGGPGEVFVVGSNAPHGFKALSGEVLRMVCIHANESMITTWLDGRD